MRRMSGIWPPSKPMRMELPERAVWPLPPRPEVLPWPLDSPLPRRLRRCLAPGRGFKSCKRITVLCSQARSGRLSLRNGCRRRGFGFHRDSAATIDFFALAQLQQRVQCRFDDVGRVLGTERLAEDILHARGFEHSTDGFTG